MLRATARSEGTRIQIQRSPCFRERDGPNVKANSRNARLVLPASRTRAVQCVQNDRAPMRPPGVARQSELHRLPECRNGNRHGPDDDSKHDADEQRDEARIGALLAADGLPTSAGWNSRVSRCAVRHAAIAGRELHREQSLTKYLSEPVRLARGCHS